MAGASLPCLGCSLSLRTAAAASGLPISARSRTRNVSSVAQDTNCMVLPTPPPWLPPPSLLPGLAAAATRGSGRGERAEPGARRQLLTLGVAEVSSRGSRLRSAEQRRRLPRAEPLGPQEEPEEEEEDWGSAARPHNVQGAGRRRRGTCAPRRAGRPVLPGIAERLLEWGAVGAEAGGGRGSSAAQIPRVPASGRRGEEKAKRVGTAPFETESPPRLPVRVSQPGRGLQEAEVRGARCSGASRSRSPPPRADRLF